MYICVMLFFLRSKCFRKLELCVCKPRKKVESVEVTKFGGKAVRCKAGGFCFFIIQHNLRNGFGARNF